MDHSLLSQDGLSLMYNSIDDKRKFIDELNTSSNCIDNDTANSSSKFTKYLSDSDDSEISNSHIHTHTSKLNINDDENFIRELQISPDGKFVSLSHEDSNVNIMNINQDIINRHLYYQINEEHQKELINQIDYSSTYHLFKNIDVGESIFDLKWYPLMHHEEDSTSSLLATTTRDHPIHLWDINTGKIRCSYTGFNQYDELDVANSISFNLSGERLYSGSLRMLRMFDISYGGKNYQNIPLCKSNKDMMGQRGIISAISFNPDYSKSFAAGSYSGSVGIYVEDMNECALEISNLGINGITYMKWSPCGNMLWVGGRCCGDIVCWDIRNTRKQLGKVERTLNTNQKMYFDLDPWGKYLVTGSQFGELLVYDTLSFHEVTRTVKLELNCINTARFHPFSSLLLTSCGQRNFETINSNANDDAYEDKSNQFLSGYQVWKIPSNPIQLTST